MPAYAAPQSYAAPTQGRGPPGSVREPWIAIILAIVTLGLYSLYYWWVASREVDEYTQKPGNSHNLVRVGTIISIVSGIVLLFALFSFLGSIFADAAAGREPAEEEIVAMIFGGIGLFVIAAMAMFVGSIIRLVGKWKLWTALEQDERARAHPTPLSAGLMIALVIGSWFVPLVGWVLPLVVMYMTQEHLNQAWNAAGAATRPYS